MYGAYWSKEVLFPIFYAGELDFLFFKILQTPLNVVNLHFREKKSTSGIADALNLLSAL